MNFGLSFYLGVLIFTVIVWCLWRFWGFEPTVLILLMTIIAIRVSWV